MTLYTACDSVVRYIGTTTSPAVGDIFQKPTSAMNSMVVHVTLVVAVAAVVVLTSATNASGVGRRVKKREKRDFGSELGPSPSVHFGSGPFFVSGPDSLSGRDIVVSRDFISGLGYSSGLKYGPGLGLSSRASSLPSEQDSASEQDLAPSPSSPLPSSVAPAGRSGGPQEQVAFSTTPRYTTTARSSVPVSSHVLHPVLVPASSYPSPVDRPVLASDPFIVAAISYGPSDPGYVPFGLGNGPSATGYGPFAASNDGGWSLPYGGQAQTADRLSSRSAYSTGKLLYGFNYKK